MLLQSQARKCVELMHFVICFLIFCVLMRLVSFQEQDLQHPPAKYGPCSHQKESDVVDIWSIKLWCFCRINNLSDANAKRRHRCLPMNSKGIYFCTSRYTRAYNIYMCVYRERDYIQIYRYQLPSLQSTICDNIFMLIQVVQHQHTKHLDKQNSIHSNN